MAYEHRTLLGAGSLVVESVRVEDPTPPAETTEATTPPEKPRKRRLLWTADIATPRQLKSEAYQRRRDGNRARRSSRRVGR